MLAGMNIVSRAERNFHDGCVKRQCVPQYLAWPDVRINQHKKKLFIKIYYVKKTFPSNITKCPKFGNRKPVVIDHFECLEMVLYALVVWRVLGIALSVYGFRHRLSHPLTSGNKTMFHRNTHAKIIQHNAYSKQTPYVG